MDDLIAAAEQSASVRQLREFTDWVGEGRKLTQTGRIKLADARELVPLLNTGDTLDPQIGDRVFKTTTTTELPGLNLIVDWARAARLVRVVKGRLVPVQKNKALVSRPLELWDRAFEVFGSLGAALCHNAPIEQELERVLSALYARLYDGPLRLGEACALAWDVASAPYAIQAAPEMHQQTWRRFNDRGAKDALRALHTLGAVTLRGDDPGSVAELTPLGLRAVRLRLGEAGPGDPVYQLTVTLLEVDGPPVWRRMAVSANTSLDRLHSTIQAVMGWQNCHLHVFEADGVRYGFAEPELEFADERQTTLADLVTGDGTRIGYTYDFGDDWHHEIFVEKVFTASENDRYPLCVDGRGACPPEDCGGPPGYEHLREILADPDHLEHDDRLEWLGLDEAAQFAPESFDPERATAALRRIA